MPPFYWLQFRDSRQGKPPVIDPRRRLRICRWGFLLALGVVLGRMAQLEWTQGAGFREEALQPLVRRQALDGVRGRILARDGTVLACDRRVLALAVHYRNLQAEPDPGWLRNAARLRLSRADRKDPQRVAAEEVSVAAERRELSGRLAALCGVSMEQWSRRAKQIETRVERIAEEVNARRRPSADEEPERITVGEELGYHVMVEDVSREVVAEVEADPRRYAGVKIVQTWRRTYPQGPLACHVLGHLGPGGMTVPSVGMVPDVDSSASDAMPPHAQDRVGRMGVERQYEHLLRGRRGLVVEQIDRSGRVVSSWRESEPGVGRDVALTLDSKLQAAAESLLEDALHRRAVRQPGARPAGGAIVVMDCRNGAILAMASAPGFDPNPFAGGENPDAAALLHDPAHPLFDRVARMAIPPGSVFKTVTAAALLEASAVRPKATFDCRGYLHTPDQWRCAIYRRQGIGHGEVTLADALAESCNVYFFHHAGRLRAEVLVDWASRFGFGRPTGLDLPGEAAGCVGQSAAISSTPRPQPAWTTADTQLLAVGQGSLEATPLQVARMMAAVANGGNLVTPHVVRGLGLTQLGENQSDWAAAIDVAPPRPIPGLHPATLAAIREGLHRVVSNPKGTGYGTVRLESIEIAGKTGTAQTGVEGDHAWFAGYVPADNPKIVVVVALEHAGDGAEAAGPIAKRLVLRMQQSGYLGVAGRAEPGRVGPGESAAGRVGPGESEPGRVGPGESVAGSRP
jgi:penicillin-binding protein 2